MQRAPPPAPAAARGAVAKAASERVSERAGDEWATVLSGALGETAVLPSMRCPHGCRFRVHAQNLTGWTVYSPPSVVVTTPAEPPLPAGAVRVEMAAELGAGIGASDFAIAIANALDVDSADRVRLAYSYVPSAALPHTGPGSSGVAETYVVLDLMPPTTSGPRAPAEAMAPLMRATSREEGGADGPSAAGEEERAQGPRSAAELAEALARLLASHSRLLWGHAVTQGLVARAGLVRVHANGTQAHLWSTTSDDSAEESILAAARQITSVLVGLGVALMCVLSCGTHLRSAPSRTSAMPAETEEREHLKVEG